MGDARVDYDAWLLMVDYDYRLYNAIYIYIYRVWFGITVVFYLYFYFMMPMGCIKNRFNYGASFHMDPCDHFFLSCTTRRQPQVLRILQPLKAQLTLVGLRFRCSVVYPGFGPWAGLGLTELGKVQKSRFPVGPESHIKDVQDISRYAGWWFQVFFIFPIVFPNDWLVD